MMIDRLSILRSRNTTCTRSGAPEDTAPNPGEVPEKTRAHPPASAPISPAARPDLFADVASGAAPSVYYQVQDV